MEKNNHRALYIYAVISVLFFAEKEIFESLPFGIFFALAPILAIADNINSNGWKMPLLLIASVAIGNSVFQVFVHSGVHLTDAIYSAGSIITSVLFYRIFRMRMSTTVSLLGFILLMMLFDYLNFLWTGINDRIIVAETFSGVPHWVQWYSITGILGGTLWVTLVNIIFYFIFFVANPLFKRQFRWRTTIIALIVIIIPVIGSIRWMDTFEYEPTYQNIDFPILTNHWQGLLIAENPENNYNSMLNRYDEYLGRTSVWLLLLLILSFLVRLKINKDPAL